ncbi:hypothetical protein BURPS1710b_1013 [Burkholderia pseudomallei 1710b]|uniref:Uncharacterized protein n=1 Tax=Burkholderia pseudomallei (strain 1710b) TaxID=320372 RepID=Q3JVH9_BURP1|nr:hypothetical protein BURPS1710b_1013 [Burkholderia pseudomallei 1710b]
MAAAKRRLLSHYRPNRRKLRVVIAAAGSLRLPRERRLRAALRRHRDRMGLLAAVVARAHGIAPRLEPDEHVGAARIGLQHFAASRIEHGHVNVGQILAACAREAQRERPAAFAALERGGLVEPHAARHEADVAVVLHVGQTGLRARDAREAEGQRRRDQVLGNALLSHDSLLESAGRSRRPRRAAGENDGRRPPAQRGRPPRCRRPCGRRAGSPGAPGATGSAQIDRHENLGIVTLDQQRKTVARALDRVAQLFGARDGPPVHRENHVAGLDARARGGPRRLLDDQAVRERRAVALARRQRAHRDAEPPLLDGLVGARLRLIVGERRERHRYRLPRLVAPDLQIGLRARLHARDLRGQRRRILNRHAVDREDHVARLQPGLRGRPLRIDRADERAVGLLQAERTRERLIEPLHGDAEPAAAHVARLHELVLHLHRLVDRDRERQPLEAARLRVDHRVDADHLAVQVEQRAARVAGVHGHVGLDERRVVLVGQRTRLRADDARGDRVVEPVRRADRDDPLADLALRRIADLHDRQARSVDLQHRDVGLLVGADDLRLVLALVGELHGHDVRTVDHVRVSQDIPVGADDEAGAEARARLVVRLRLAAAAHPGNLPVEMSEELIERIVRVDRQLRRRATLRGALHDVLRADVHDGRPVGLDQPGKIGDARLRGRLGRHQRGDRRRDDLRLRPAGARHIACRQRRGDSHGNCATCKDSGSHRSLSSSNGLKRNDPGLKQA